MGQTISTTSKWQISGWTNVSAEMEVYDAYSSHIFPACSPLCAIYVLGPNEYVTQHKNTSRLSSWLVCPCSIKPYMSRESLPEVTQCYSKVWVSCNTTLRYDCQQRGIRYIINKANKIFFTFWSMRCSICIMYYCIMKYISYHTFLSVTQSFYSLNLCTK